MAVCFDSDYSSYSKSAPKKVLCAGPTPEGRSSKCITIGLINNMPDAALEATERQFISLLQSASERMHLRLSFHALPNVPRDRSAARHLSNYYSSTENLWGKRLDGLIVTGREPLTPNLADEPYWESFGDVLEWAKDNTYSTIWSCLAAHAALLRLDGIGRVRSNHKYSGVFECDRLSDHQLTTDSPASFKLPHSRWNGVPEGALIDAGYSILTRSPEAGVDTFVKQYKSLFVFFQGHPEYESNTLLLEYRRDIGRYLRGEISRYPLMPRDYFDHETAIALTALQIRATSQPREDLLAEISIELGKTRIDGSWHSTSTCIYRNWLEYICAQKELQLKRTPLPSRQTHDSSSLYQILSS